MKPRVAYLGGQGSFGHEAATRLFDESTHQLVSCPSQQGIVNAVVEGQVHRGIVAIENQLKGPVPETFTAIANQSEQCYVRRQTTVPIDLRFWMHKAGDETKRVYTYSAAAEQCTKLLRVLEGQGVELVPVGSTIEGVARAAVEPGAGAIASAQAGKWYDVIDTSSGFTGSTDLSVADQQKNWTRFWEVGSSARQGVRQRTLLKLLLNNEPNALATALGFFGRRGINNDMTFSVRQPGGYVFCVDLECSDVDERFTDALADIDRAPGKCGVTVISLGSYQVQS